MIEARDSQSNLEPRKKHNKIASHHLERHENVTKNEASCMMDLKGTLA